MSETTPGPETTPGSGGARPPARVVPRTAAGGADTRASRPSRPPVSVAPMREPVPDERPRAVDAAVVFWAVAVVGLVALAGLVGVRHTEVRMSLRRSLTTEHPATKASDIGNLVDIALLVAAGLAVVVVLLVLYGALRLRQRIVSGRAVLTTMAVLTAVGSVAFWDVIGPARGELTPAASVLPFVVAVLAVGATVCTFTPDVRRWLRSAPLR